MPIKTENIYCEWVKRFIRFPNMQDKNELLENFEEKLGCLLMNYFGGKGKCEGVGIWLAETRWRGGQC